MFRTARNVHWSRRQSAKIGAQCNALRNIVGGRASLGRLRQTKGAFERQEDRKLEFSDRF
jgi:hypothetical protein